MWGKNLYALLGTLGSKESSFVPIDIKTDFFLN